VLPQQAGQDPPAGPVGGRGEDGGGDVRGRRGLVIARTASRRPAVNDIRAGVTGVCAWRAGPDASWAAAPARAAWQPWMRISWVAVIQAHISWVTWCGDDERRIGPREGPASVIADLSSPITVSVAAHRPGQQAVSSAAG
jgi:hypothetical protein